MNATRRQAREWAIQMLTAADLNPPEDMDAFLAAGWEQLGSLDEDEEAGGPPRGKLKAFAEERVRGVIGRVAAIDAQLAPLMENWDISRLGTVERAVLRMGAWELANTDIPKAVVINEAIDLANWFSSPKSRTLVNGILDRLSKSRA